MSVISLWSALDRLQTLLVNPLVAWLLQTPLHDLLSSRVMLLTVTGRRSGAAIRLPVQYERHGDTFTVISRPSRLWWRNLEGGAPVQLVLRGEMRRGHATVSRESAHVVAAEQQGHVLKSRIAPGGPVVVIRLGTQDPAPARGGERMWWRWTRAVTLGEMAGFTVPAVVGAVVSGPEWGMLGIGPLLQGAAIVMAGAVEGAILGLAQAYALRSALPAIATRDWVRATAVGAVMAWIVGAMPIVLGERVLRWPPAVLALLGLTLLVAMGLLQWRVLRRHVRRAFWWVIATAGSWLVALGAFALVTTPLWQEGQPGWLVVAIGLLGGAVMAATVAALTGAALVRLPLRPRPQ
ncbi:nitroreductase/quinone reductase family protein [Nonomuraea basaltis]|uniref:nitroreductase/quinone reductase family protein n=1 Tax=Nonomuraea basaltis TaxID=2495887 RepID=UPI00110C419A|nr:nitroreductase/quinone reductase family protein [Nonomuraea basaltis]TMS00334.1 nitroreductase family deazaflavin-dependent oxidoreductase [Nonomuraea basaltis]